MGSLKFKMEEGRWLLYARAAIQKTSPPIPSMTAASFLAFKHIHRSEDISGRFDFLFHQCHSGLKFRQAYYLMFFEKISNWLIALPLFRCEISKIILANWR